MTQVAGNIAIETHKAAELKLRIFGQQYFPLRDRYRTAPNQYYAPPPTNNQQLTRPLTPYFTLSLNTKTFFPSATVTLLATVLTS